MDRALEAPSTYVAPATARTFAPVSLTYRRARNVKYHQRSRSNSRRRARFIRTGPSDHNASRTHWHAHMSMKSVITSVLDIALGLQVPPEPCRSASRSRLFFFSGTKLSLSQRCRHAPEGASRLSAPIALAAVGARTGRQARLFFRGVCHWCSLSSRASRLNQYATILASFSCRKDA